LRQIEVSSATKQENHLFRYLFFFFLTAKVFEKKTCLALYDFKLLFTTFRKNLRFGEAERALMQ